jgi:hypothetical protein
MVDRNGTSMYTGSGKANPTPVRAMLVLLSQFVVGVTKEAREGEAPKSLSVRVSRSLSIRVLIDPSSGCLIRRSVDPSIPPLNVSSSSLYIGSGGASRRNACMQPCSDCVAADRGVSTQRRCHPSVRTVMEQVQPISSRFPCLDGNGSWLTVLWRTVLLLRLSLWPPSVVARRRRGQRSH